MLSEDGFSGFKVNEEVVVFDPKNICPVNAEFEDLDSPELLKAKGGVTDINDIDTLRDSSRALKSYNHQAQVNDVGFRKQLSRRCCREDAANEGPW